jgi:hypothetical protein
MGSMEVLPVTVSSNVHFVKWMNEVPPNFDTVAWSQIANLELINTKMVNAQ